MRKVSVDILCDLHPDRKAIVEGFRFYWPLDESWREADLCDDPCGLGPDMRALIDAVRPLGTMRRHPDQSVPYVAGISWVLCANVHGKGAEHATANNRTSLCGHIKEADRMVGPGTGQLPPCARCVSALRERTGEAPPIDKTKGEETKVEEPTTQVGTILADLRKHGPSAVQIVAERTGFPAHRVANVLKNCHDEPAHRANRVTRGVYEFSKGSSDG